MAGEVPSFQDVIDNLNHYWASRGCVLMSPYHTEVGAGTFNPATLLRSLGEEPWRAAYVEPSIPHRRALRGQPLPPAALLPVPGPAEARARRRAGALPGLAHGPRPRAGAARRALR